MAKLNYRNVHIVFDVQKEGTDKWNEKSVMCGLDHKGLCEGKGSENFKIAPIAKDTGILSSTRGLYFPRKS